MSFLVSSAPSSNPSLASSLGNATKGRLLISFPFPLDTGWYTQQTCTIFRTFEHRKERQGFRHEFILLRLLDGSVCRIERMGDPNARLDAISPQGSVAYDIAQSFQPDEMDKACLGTSDVIAEVTLPCDFDIMDVLKICRAIHEGEKTRKYTLQIYNCWFFSLAIQVCLARLIAGWESSELVEDWLSYVYGAAERLNLQDHNPAIPSPPSYLPTTFRICDILTAHHAREHPGTAMEAVKLRLQSRLACFWGANKERLAQGINDLLWYSTILSNLSNLIEVNAKEAMLDVLQERFLVPSASGPDVSCTQSFEQLKDQLLTILTTLLHLAGVEMPECLEPTLGFTKRKLTHQTTSKSTKSCERTNCLDFNGSHEKKYTQNTVDWCQWVNQCASYLVCFVLWLLRTALIVWGVTLLYPWAEPTLCIIIDQQLENMAAELERLDIDSITCADLERCVQELRALTENGDAVWAENPWKDICRFISQRVPDAIFKSGGAELVCFKPNYEEQHETRGVVNFQAHVLDRIRIHAQEVEKKLLGSAAHIQTELEDVLSQVWKMIREDNSISQKATPRPLLTPEIALLQQHAERYGYKLQPDPGHQPTDSHSQSLYQMERQADIERLQRTHEDAASMHLSGLGPIPLPTEMTTGDQLFEGSSSPQLSQPLFPPLIFPQTHSPPPSSIPELPANLDHSFSGAKTSTRSTSSSTNRSARFGLNISTKPIWVPKIVGVDDTRSNAKDVMNIVDPTSSVESNWTPSRVV